MITPASQQARRSAHDDAEYRRNYVSFEYVNALYALDSGYTGQNVLVGVLDDGVKTVSELSGQISSLSRDFGAVTQNGVTTGRNVVGDDWSDHGTMVAGVIAARNDGSGVQGIAPDAQIVALRISTVDLDESDPDKAESLGIHMADALDYAGQNGVKVVNASIAKADSSVPSSLWANAVARYVATGGLFVNAAGNDAEANATGYLDVNGANRQGWLFVVGLEGTQTSYELTDYSNQCGATVMDHCVAAMGTNATQAVDGSYVWFSGTSAAAPQVSGLAALILSKWPQLTGVQAGEVILATARDIGDPGVDAVFGHGLVDVRAALSPVNPTLSNGTVTTSAATATLLAPPAIGTTGIKTTALASVTVLDGYGRDFSGDLSGLVAKPGEAPRNLERQVDVQARAGSSHFESDGLQASMSFSALREGPGAGEVRGLLTGGELAVRTGSTWLTASLRSTDAVSPEFMGLAPSSDAAFAYSPLADMAFGAEHPLAGGRLGIAVVGGSEDEAGATRRAAGTVVSWRRHRTSLKAGLIDERGAVFGTPTGNGALRLGDGATTAFVEAARTMRLGGGWDLSGYASLGATRLKLAQDMLLTHAGTLATTRFGITASHRLAGGVLRFGIAQPLTVVAGQGTYTLATGYDLASRSLVYGRRNVDFSGGIDPLLTFGFEKGGAASQLRLAAAARTDCGDLRVLGTWRITLR